MNKKRATQEEMRELLREWESVRGYGSDMTWDGILNDSYWETNPRVLFLLKDTRDDFTYIAPAPTKGYGPEGVSLNFWGNINSWQHVISMRWDNAVPTEEEIRMIRKKPVKDIAYLNIKKKQGTSAISWKELRSYAIRDKKFLIRQLEMIDPQVIICCGINSIFDLLKDYIMDEKGYEDEALSKDMRIHKFGPWIVANWGHPSDSLHKNNISWVELDADLSEIAVQKKIQEMKAKL